MFILTSPSHIFYTAGKIATQSLRTIPDSQQIFPNSKTASLRAGALTNIKRMIAIDHRPITVVVREPRSRFMSGLFELVAKHIYSPFIEFQAALNVDSSTILNQISVFYNSKWWDLAFDRTLRLSPQTWIQTEELDSSRWQYHVGNWLADVVELESTAFKLDKKLNIVTIEDLSSYLTSLGLPARNRNKREHFLFALSENYEHLYNSIDHDAIHKAFNQAYANLALDLRTKFENYVNYDTSIYNKLLTNSTMLYRL